MGFVTHTDCYSTYTYTHKMEDDLSTHTIRSGSQGATKGEDKDTENKDDPKRIQLLFSKAAYAELEELQKEAGLANRSDVIRNAVRLYRWYLDQKREGYALQLEKDSRVKEIELFF